MPESWGLRVIQPRKIQVKLLRFEWRSFVGKLVRRKKKIPVVLVPDRPYFFLPTLLFFQHDWPCDPIFSRWLRAVHTACQNGICCHTNYWTKLPKFIDRKYASLVNIDVGTLLQIAQQKIFKKNFISDLLTLIFSRYETGTTGIFFYALTTNFPTKSLRSRHQSCIFHRIFSL
jgi:hypothetical protein